MALRINRRATAVILASLVMIVGLLFYSLHLQQSLDAQRTATESANAQLNRKEAEIAKTDTYIQTICAEYRKLYQSYRDLRYGDQPGVDPYVGLPGSAKGDIDDCYLPE